MQKEKLVKYGIGSLTCLLLLVGCGSGNHQALEQKIENQKAYCKNLQKSEKIQFYENNETKALFTATYLFSQTSDSNDTREEQFVIGMFTDDEGMEGLGNGYTVSLEGEAPKSITPLDAQSKYLQNMPVMTEWSEYYLVTFPHTSKKKFDLIFTNELYGKQQMHFAKVAKYVISKKVY